MAEMQRNCYPYLASAAALQGLKPDISRSFAVSVLKNGVTEPRSATKY